MGGLLDFVDMLDAAATGRRLRRERQMKEEKLSWEQEMAQQKLAAGLQRSGEALTARQDQAKGREGAARDKTAAFRERTARQKLGDRQRYELGLIKAGYKDRELQARMGRWDADRDQRERGLGLVEQRIGMTAADKGLIAGAEGGYERGATRTEREHADLEGVREQTALRSVQGSLAQQLGRHREEREPLARAGLEARTSYTQKLEGQLGTRGKTSRASTIDKLKAVQRALTGLRSQDKGYGARPDTQRIRQFEQMEDQLFEELRSGGGAGGQEIPEDEAYIYEMAESMAMGSMGARAILKSINESSEFSGFSPEDQMRIMQELVKRVGRGRNTGR